jgi:hypothetical protein
MKPTLLNLVLLTGASISAAAQLPTACLSMDSFGPIHVGMTLERTRDITGPAATEQLLQNDCGFLMLHRDGVQFMIRNGKVSRIDVIDAQHPTLSGLRVGDSEGRAHHVYERRLEVKRHAYDDNGHHLVLRSEDKKRAVLLETDGKLIRK